MNFRNKKRLQVINYVFQKLGRDEENKEFLIKLVYLADKFFLLRYGSTITCDRFIAFPRGPVSAQTLAILDRNEEHIEDNENTVVEEFEKLYDYTQRPKTKKVHTIFAKDVSNDFGALSKNEMKVLDIIVETFGKMQYDDLKEYTHTFSEWKKHEKDLCNGKTHLQIDVKDMFKDREFTSNKKLAEYFTEEIIQNSVALYNGEF